MDDLSEATTADLVTMAITGYSADEATAACMLDATTGELEVIRSWIYMAEPDKHEACSALYAIVGRLRVIHELMRRERRAKAEARAGNGAARREASHA